MVDLNFTYILSQIIPLSPSFLCFHHDIIKTENTLCWRCSSFFSAHISSPFFKKNNHAALCNAAHKRGKAGAARLTMDLSTASTTVTCFDSLTRNMYEVEYPTSLDNSDPITAY